MEQLHKIEKYLEPMFEDSPKLSKRVKEWFVKFWPIIALLLGVIEIWYAYQLYHHGRQYSQYSYLANNLSNAYGNGQVVHPLGLMYWISLIFLLIVGVVLLMSYSGLKARTKQGWDMLFLASILNVAFGIIDMLDTYYGGIAILIRALITSLIAIYILFQILPYYKASTAKTNKK